jgi:hypothetical protein
MCSVFFFQRHILTDIFFRPLKCNGEGGKTGERNDDSAGKQKGLERNRVKRGNGMKV